MRCIALIYFISKFLPIGEQTTYRIKHSITAAKPSGPGVNERFIFLDTHVFGLGEDIVSELYLSVYTDLYTCFGEILLCGLCGFIYRGNVRV